MTVLFEIGHPAHLHYFRNTAIVLQNNGTKVYFCLREKDITKLLLEKFQFNFFIIGKSKRGKIRKFLGIFSFTFQIVKIIKKTKADMIISFYSPYAAYASFLTGIVSIGLADTEHAKINIKTTYPFTDVTLTPESFNKKLGKKHLTFKGFMELSYLHHNYYIPDKSILSLLNVEKSNYVILRFVSWNAHHDFGQSGLNQITKNAIIERLKSEYRIYISSEGILPEEFEPYRIKIPVDRIHDVLAYAYLFIGEGATMASECAMLGTPAIYVNSLDAGTLQEQERQGLIASFRTSEGVIEKIEEWLSNRNLHKEMKLKRDKMMKEMIDPTKLLVWFIENYPLSIQIMKENPDYQLRFK